MTDRPTIDDTVDDKIDDKIGAAQLPPMSQSRAAVNMPSNTTIEEDLRTRSQRNLNLIWEITQAIIAVVVTIATLIVASVLALRAQIETAAFLLLSNAFFLIIGFYFSRSNHARIGDQQKKTSGGLDDR